MTLRLGSLTALIAAVVAGLMTWAMQESPLERATLPIFQDTDGGWWCLRLVETTGYQAPDGRTAFPAAFTPCATMAIETMGTLRNPRMFARGAVPVRTLGGGAIPIAPLSRPMVTGPVGARR